jgi:electron transport complex protein RnfB
MLLNNNDKINTINNYLPQTQCRKCGYNGCLPYATAISNNQADINRCSPGGTDTIKNLANLLNRPTSPLAADVKPSATQPQVAKINEAECIGCLLCIKACPVDAIVGANKLMHTVITDQCTGCDLCIEPCPMSCISLVNIKSDSSPDKIKNKQQLLKFKHNLKLSRQENKNTNKQNIDTNLNKKSLLLNSIALAKAKNKKPN